MSLNEPQTKCKSAGQGALTFDEGPTPYTLAVLDALKKENIKATFHVITEFLQDKRIMASLRRAVDDGHLIGLRLRPNINPLKVSEKELIRSINNDRKILENIVGYRPKFIRLPYKHFNNKTLEIIESLGMEVTQHSVDSFDYSMDFNDMPSPNSIYDRFEDQIKNMDSKKDSFISVQRDLTRATAMATEKIVALLKTKQFKLCLDIVQEGYKVENQSTNESLEPSEKATDSPMKEQESKKSSDQKSNSKDDETMFSNPSSSSKLNIAGYVIPLAIIIALTL
ncbi:glycoside hydrolase/deacetylase [Rozella allomycis CSF55]|uniref:Glycoside hydrolase/deacetylase n=1 Tax=Rozella allomycis (strain CSF55) TaxID=988480 RepID=A0A075AMF5_ROZAC|nr:Glycoside hydrolase/deacetylase, beta/alpha-barrel domain-containing protein [Rozella allomycis CSF55]RKP17577.1 glycoside hydrolase/deacetylase [Rozella allomycis CSF55]|eukprot:EPZ30799.1 Glycoside hydrolase/deacetylase, beta/alpha-barrel domain-containing protein [Rozella allomycis CSF55]